jgi:hypothetical protein
MKVVYRDPSWNPFTQMMSLSGNEPAGNSKYWWVLQDECPGHVQINMAGNLGAGVTTVVVDSTVGFHEGDVLFTEASGGADEWMLIGTVTNATTLEVTRGFTNSASGIVADDVKLYKATKNWKEGGEPSVESYDYSDFWNWVSGHGSQVTESLRKSLEDDRFDDTTYQRQEALTEHNKDVERGLILNNRYKDTIGSDVYYNGGGLRFWTAQAETMDAGNHVLTATQAAFDMDDWRDYTWALHNYGNGRKYMLVGGGLLRKIRGLYDSTWVRSVIPKLEFTVFDLDTWIGFPLTIIPHRMLVNDWFYTGFGFDENYVKAKTLLPTSVLKVDYGAKTRKGFNVITMKSLKCRNPLTLASLTLTA